MQGFQEELYSPKETPILIFFLELTIELAALDYPATISELFCKSTGTVPFILHVGNIYQQISGDSHVSTHVFEIYYIGTLIMFL